VTAELRSPNTQTVVFSYSQGQSGKVFEQELLSFRWMRIGGAEFFLATLLKSILIVRDEF
jgi:hypothetical protein